MSQNQKDSIIAALPDTYKTFIVLSREIGTFVIIIGAFVFLLWQNFDVSQYMRKNQAEYIETIVTLKTQMQSVRVELSEMKTTLRAYELRIYGQGQK